MSMYGILHIPSGNRIYWKTKECSQEFFIYDSFDKSLKEFFDRPLLRKNTNCIYGFYLVNSYKTDRLCLLRYSNKSVLTNLIKEDEFLHHIAMDLNVPNTLISSDEFMVVTDRSK